MPSKQKSKEEVYIHFAYNSLGRKGKAQRKTREAQIMEGTE